MLENPKLNKNKLTIRRALISVFDKTDLVMLGSALENLNIEILSTGGSAKTLRSEGIKVQDVSDYTKFPEIMDCRVKTINCLVDGGILGLRVKHNTDA